MASFWTSRGDSKLREMWGKRLASEIATELDTTSNAVIGRVHRLMRTYKEQISKRQAAAQKVARKR
jgi:hypothetical protein